MRWYRSNQRLGGCLALFALWLQFVASFAHIHPEAMLHPEALLRSVGTDLVSASLVVISDDGQKSAAPVPTHQDNRPLNGSCLVCTSVSLLGAGQSSESPSIATPVAFDTAYLPSIAEFDVPSVRRFSFRTRAPPTA